MTRPPVVAVSVRDGYRTRYLILRLDTPSGRPPQVLREMGSRTLAESWARAQSQAIQSTRNSSPLRFA